MPPVKIIFLGLLLSILSCDNSLGQGKKRPPFEGKIMSSAKKVKFDDIKTTVEANSDPRHVLTKKPFATHLAHVFPWASIDECVEFYKNKKAMLRELIDKIFEIDSDARVNKAFENAQIYDANKKKNYQGFLPKVNGKTPMMTHRQYLGKDLVAVNTELKNEAITAMNANNLAVLKSKLNSAPANLRYGDGQMNVKVYDRPDFMGDRNGKVTKHERDLWDLLDDCTKKYKSALSFCNRNTDYCFTDGKKSHIRSSSSAEGYITL